MKDLLAIAALRVVAYTCVAYCIGIVCAVIFYAFTGSGLGVFA